MGQRKVRQLMLNGRRRNIPPIAEVRGKRNTTTQTLTSTPEREIKATDATDAINAINAINATVDSSSI